MAKRWAGRMVTEARAIVEPLLPAPCSRCGRIVEADEDWTTDHIPGRDQLPEDQWLNPAVLHPAHGRCNYAAGARYGNRKRARDRRLFLADQTAPALPLPGIFQPGPEPDWSTPWSAEPRVPGEWDGLPRTMPGPHPEAVGSLGESAAEWIEARRGSPLRWWQWLTLQRMHEHRADGSWCWPLSFVSVSRQQGKTILLGEETCRICGTSAEPVEVAHSANTVLMARGHQSLWYPWARRHGFPIVRQLGDSQIVWPGGSIWRTVAQSNMWGRSLDVAMIDEAWAWTAEEFWSGVYPTLVERRGSVARLWSAANDESSGLVETLQDDASILTIEWGATTADDPLSPATWRKASALWSPAREEAMRTASTKPGFATNWLNIWPPRKSGGRWIAAPLTARTARGRVSRVPPEGALCGVECSLDGKRWALAAAWRQRSLILARVWEADTLDACLAIAGARPWWAHAAIVERLGWSERGNVQSISGSQYRAAAGVLRQLVTAGTLRTAGMPEAVWEGIQTTPGEGGEAIDAKRSVGDVQAAKALALAVWAVTSQATGFVL